MALGATADRRIRTPTSASPGQLILAAIFAGFTSPITAPQILWVNMVTSVALGLRIRRAGEATRRTAGL